MRRQTGGKRKIKRPGRIRYILLGGLISLYAMIVKRHRKKSTLPEGLKPPFIVVGNHTTFYDFIYAIRSLYPRRINFVVARKYFHFPGLRLFMKLGCAIPKSLFQPDTGTIVAMLGILRRGGVVGIFPEGQISIGGITGDYGDAIARLVKKAGVPVVRVLTGGAYFCNPPWSKTARKGRIESRVDLVLTTTQTERLSVSDIMAKLREGTYMDNYAWQEAAGHTYRGRDLAEGLQNILYRCPCCEGEYTIHTRGDWIVCESCGMEVRFGADGHLSPSGGFFQHVGQWLAWQVEGERDSIVGDEAFEVSEPVELAMIIKGSGVCAVGSGTFSAGREVFVYTGTALGRPVRLEFPVSATRCLPFDSGRNFQIYQRDLLYEFRPANPKWCMKIAVICEALHTLPEREERSLRPAEIHLGTI